jgi:hypothetical protein
MEKNEIIQAAFYLEEAIRDHVKTTKDFECTYVLINRIERVLGEIHEENVRQAAEGMFINN